MRVILATFWIEKQKSNRKTVHVTLNVRFNIIDDDLCKPRDVLFSELNFQRLYSTNYIYK